jgi:hypothetical protein
LNLVFNDTLPDAQSWVPECARTLLGAGKNRDKPGCLATTNTRRGHLLIDNFPQRLQLYREAIAMQPEPWQLKSMCKQALRTTRQLKGQQVAADLAQTFNKSLA